MKISSRVDGSHPYTIIVVQLIVDSRHRRITELFTVICWFSPGAWPQPRLIAPRIVQNTWPASVPTLRVYRTSEPPWTRKSCEWIGIGGVIFSYWTPSGGISTHSGWINSVQFPKLISLLHVFPYISLNILLNGLIPYQSCCWTFFLNRGERKSIADVVVSWQSARENS